MALVVTHSPVTLAAKYRPLAPWYFTYRWRVAADDHDTPPPQVRARRAYHSRGRLDWRGRWLHSSRRCRCDQPGCSDVACRLSRDGVDRLVCHRPVSPRLAANRACHVTGDQVGLVPALLGPDLSAADHHCYCRLAGGNADNPL